jgi:ADP-heptose:LPS heptosyltransferase
MINSCKLFIGNLSAPLTVAFACHKPNIVGFNSSIDDIHNKNMYLSQTE